MDRSPFPSHEYALLAGLADILGESAAPGGAYELTLGDDAAVRSCAAGERLVITTDVAVENTHFTLDTMTMREIGFRAMAANVSDCAAMGAAPESALIDLVFPNTRTDDIKASVEELYRGFAEACSRWSFRIVGGDLARGAAWTIGITMIGCVPGPGRLLKRKGALPGDRLWVSALPGQSAAGLAALSGWGRSAAPEYTHPLIKAHVRPLPDVLLGQTLASLRSVHAMMDLSDGLSKDCRTLCHENGLGIDLDFTDISPSVAMVRLSGETGVPWMEWVVHGGEEYSLLFAADPSFDPAVHAGASACRPVRIGTFTQEHRLLRIREGNSFTEVPPRSWDHLSNSLH